VTGFLDRSSTPLSATAAERRSRHTIEASAGTSTAQEAAVEPTVLLAKIRRLAFGSLDAADALRRIRDLFREYDEAQP
jgi:hypothetical protein